MKCINKSINLLVSILALAGPAWAAGCIQVEGARILGKHLRAAGPEWAALPDTSFAGWAPAPGTQRRMTSTELRALARRFGVQGDVPSSICFSVPAESLTRERVQQAITMSLAASSAVPESFEVVDFSRFPVARGDLTFRMDGSKPAAAGTSFVPGVVRSDGRSQPVWARLRLRYGGKRWVAVHLLRAGQPISVDGVKLEEWSGPESLPAPAGMEELVGRVPRRPVAAGQPVEPGNLETPPEVRKGDTVVVESGRGNARLSLEATAESSGRRGERIVLRNAASGRKLAATVSGPGRATVAGTASNKEEPVWRN